MAYNKLKSKYEYSVKDGFTFYRGINESAQSNQLLFEGSLVMIGFCLNENGESLGKIFSCATNDDELNQNTR